MCAFFGDDSPDQVLVGNRKIFSSPQHEHKNRLNQSGSNNSSSFSSNNVACINPFKSLETSTAYDKGTTLYGGAKGNQNSSLLSDNNNEVIDDEMEKQAGEYAEGDLMRNQSL